MTIIPRYRPFALVALLVSTLYVSGWLESIERDLLDLRARLPKRPASGELVLVAIDPASLQALNSWPWPRRYHAQALERLLAAGARRIAFDIDFSSSSTPEDDRALADGAGAGGPGSGGARRAPPMGPASSSSIPRPCPASSAMPARRRSTCARTREGLIRRVQHRHGVGRHGRADHAGLADRREASRRARC